MKLVTKSLFLIIVILIGLTACKLIEPKEQILNEGTWIETENYSVSALRSGYFYYKPSGWGISEYLIEVRYGIKYKDIEALGKEKNESEEPLFFYKDFCLMDNEGKIRKPLYTRQILFVSTFYPDLDEPDVFCAVYSIPDFINRSVDLTSLYWGKTQFTSLYERGLVFRINLKPRTLNYSKKSQVCSRN